MKNTRPLDTQCGVLIVLSVLSSLGSQEILKLLGDGSEGSTEVLRIETRASWLASTPPLEL
jgi:hypothetical protein